MSKYRRGAHHVKSHALYGPCWGSDCFTGYHSWIAFDTQEEADKAVEIANAAYRAGRKDLQAEIKKSISI